MCGPITARSGSRRRLAPQRVDARPRPRLPRARASPRGSRPRRAPSAVAASTGTQSAVTTPIGCAARVTTASASTPSAHSCACTTRAPCTCRGRSRPGGGASPRVPKPWPTPHAPAADARASRDRSGVSPTPRAARAPRAAPRSPRAAPPRSAAARRSSDARARARARAAPGDRGRARRGRARRGRRPDRRRSAAPPTRGARGSGVCARSPAAPRAGCARSSRSAARRATRCAPRARRCVTTVMRLRSRGWRAIAASTRPDSRAGLAAHERLVHALDAMRVELRGERAVGLVVLRHHQDTRRAAVEPVHDPRAQHAADRGEPAAVVQQRVHERAARVAGRGVHDHVRPPCRSRRSPRPRRGSRSGIASGSARGGIGSGGDASIQSPSATIWLRGRGAVVPAHPAVVDPAAHLRARLADQARERRVETLSVLALSDQVARRRHDPRYLRENRRRLPDPRRSSQRCR